MKILKKFSLLVLMVSFTALLAAQDALELETVKISESVYMITGVSGFTGGNIGLSVGEDGVVMIDNGVTDLLNVLKTEIAKTTDQPIDY